MARQALLARLQAISRTARVLRQDQSGLVEQFEVTAAATDQTLLTAGRKFARDAEAFSSQFIAHGMPVTFLTDLNALVDRFEARCGIVVSDAKRAVRRASAPKGCWSPGWRRSAASTRSSTTIWATMR